MYVFVTVQKQSNAHIELGFEYCQAFSPLPYDSELLLIRVEFKVYKSLDLEILHHDHFTFGPQPDDLCSKVVLDLVFQVQISLFPTSRLHPLSKLTGHSS